MGVAAAAYRGRHARLSQPLRVADREVLHAAVRGSTRGASARSAPDPAGYSYPRLMLGPVARATPRFWLRNADATDVAVTTKS